MREISNTIDALTDDAQKLTKMKRMMSAAPNSIAPLLMSALTGVNEKVKEKRPREDETLKLLEALKLSSAQAYRRYLKFTGTIGGEDGTMSFISLCSQIHDAKVKNYSEEEIAVAVRKCVAEKSNLRIYLDSKKDLSHQFFSETGTSEPVVESTNRCSSKE